jgi:hypothetical protein
MNATKLTGVTPDGKQCSVWACSVCKIAAHSEHEAEECCKPKLCACGNAVKMNYTVCTQCYHAAEVRRDQDRFDKAKKVKWTEYEGQMLYCDHNDKFYPDVESLLDEFYGDDDPPEWAYGTIDKIFSMDAQTIVEDELERQEWFEDAIDHLTFVKELQTALDAAAAQIPSAYETDYSTVVTFEDEASERIKENAE